MASVTLLLTSKGHKTMMPKFDELLLVLTFFVIKYWKVVVPATIAGIFAVGYFTGAS